MLISVTRLHLKSPLYIPAFVWHTVLSTWQIINTPGFVGGKLLRDAHGGYWTLTTWQDKPAMQNYRNSGAHRQVMPRIQDWCDEAVLVHWENEDSKLPSWEEAYGHMVVEGHFTRLSKPSPAHLKQKIPELQVSELKALPLRPRKKVESRVVEG